VAIDGPQIDRPAGIAARAEHAEPGRAGALRCPPPLSSGMPATPVRRLRIRFLCLGAASVVGPPSRRSADQPRTNLAPLQIGGKQREGVRRQWFALHLLES
jgi:hypothetical protein